MDKTNELGRFYMHDRTSYVELRDCACCHLTLLEARKGIVNYFISILALHK